MLHGVGVTADVTVTTTTETAAATSSAFNVKNPGGQGVLVSGALNITTGTATTAVVVRVRRGTDATGTVVGEAQTHTLAAAASASIPFAVLDALTDASAQQYTVTVQQTSATGNGTVNNAAIAAQVATAFE